MECGQDSSGMAGGGCDGGDNSVCHEGDNNSAHGGRYVRIHNRLAVCLQTISHHIFPDIDTLASSQSPYRFPATMQGLRQLW